MMSPQPNYLPKFPSPNIITQDIRTSICEFEGATIIYYITPAFQVIYIYVHMVESVLIIV